jgi:Leucine-rich repeat (LRR) protein
MIHSERKLYFQIKKLITQQDYDKIDEGIELLVKSNNVLFFEELLKNCSVRNGVLFASEILTVTAPRQPFMDYALWDIIGKCPNEAKIDKSLVRNNIRSVKFRDYESYLGSYHYVERFPIGITEFKNLKNLDCYDAKISIIPKEISKLTKLTVLNLTYNGIQQFQDEICKLSSLKELIFSNNYIEYLPEELGNLINLEVLELDYNRLKEIPDSISCLAKLKRIELRSNKLKKLTESIGYLQNIKELNLDNNDLTKLPKSINNLKNIGSLSLSTNKFAKFPNLELENLEELNLSKNCILVIPNEIKKLKNLEELNLCGNRGLGVFEPGITFLDKLLNLQLGTTGNLKPKPKVLYFRSRDEVEGFFYSVKVLHKLEKRIKSIKPDKSVLPEIKLVNQPQSRNIQSEIETETKKSDPTDDIIENLSNYLNSDEIDTVDIGLNLILNLNNQDVYNRILSSCEIDSGKYRYHHNDDFDFDSYTYRDYCILSLLTSADNNIVFPNKIQISKIKALDYDFNENGYPDFINKLTEIEEIILNCKGHKLKDDFFKLNKLKSVSIEDASSLRCKDFLRLEKLESILIDGCLDTEMIDIVNHTNLKTIEIKESKVKSIFIENNPQLESIIFDSVKCSKFSIANCPNLKYIEIEFSDKIPDFSFNNISSLVEIKIIRSSINNIMDFVSNNIDLVKIEIDDDKSLELKDSIKNLQNLKELILTNNDIENIPSAIGELRNLQKLNLDSNLLEALPESIANLEKLETLHLRYQSGRTKEFNSLNDIPLSVLKIKSLSEICVTWPSLKMRKFESRMAAAHLNYKSRIISN